MKEKKIEEEVINVLNSMIDLNLGTFKKLKIENKLFKYMAEKYATHPKGIGLDRREDIKFRGLVVTLASRVKGTFQLS